MNAAGSAPNMIIDETMAIYKMRLAVRGIPRNMSVILFALPVLSSAKNKMPAPASQGGRIKMRSPPKVLTGNFRPSQLSFFLS